MEDNYNGPERREFVRLDCVTPLACKVCKKETIDTLLRGYTSNISPAGLLCDIKERVNKDDILWLSFDRSVLSICEELENRVFIYQNGIIGKVVRIMPRDNGVYGLGIQFITREEQNLTHIYPTVHFFTEGLKKENGET
jgi:hypothetical protein